LVGWVEATKPNSPPIGQKSAFTRDLIAKRFISIKDLLLSTKNFGNLSAFVNHPSLPSKIQNFCQIQDLK
jgi:hypothetical protein